MEIYAECKVDGEFLELYTSDPKEFLVTVDVEGGTGYDDRPWIGYISPELYSEPDIAPPYDVQITATDGLGELKLMTIPHRAKVLVCPNSAIGGQYGCQQMPAISFGQLIGK